MQQLLCVGTVGILTSMVQSQGCIVRTMVMLGKKSCFSMNDVLRGLDSSLSLFVGDEYE